MVDFSSILQLLFSLVETAALTAISILVPFAINWLLKKTKLDKLVSEDVIRAYLDQALVKAVHFGKAEAEKIVGTVNTKVEVEDRIVAFALEYAVKAVPDAIKHFGITEDGLRAMITARLAELGIETTKPLPL